MKLSDIALPDLRRQLDCGELMIQMGPFVARIQSRVASLVSEIALMYAEFPTRECSAFADFHVRIAHDNWLRRYIKPEARFFFDGKPSFTPLAEYQAFAMLEWGLNWCVSAHCHQFLIVHAAVVERDGLAALLPAPPGSGKSTLCAALIQRGWRLLSDELALIDMDTCQVRGMARPVNLKNQSIDIIRRFEPSAIFTARVPNTTKGTVALLRPPDNSVRRMDDPARIAWIVLPNYQPRSSVQLELANRSSTFMLLAEQSFNYDLHGRRGFDTVGRLVASASCHRLTYSNLDDAIGVFESLNSCSRQVSDLQSW